MELRSWIHGDTGEVLGRGFAKYQPDVKFEDDMYGNASAMGALYTGKGDIAILGRRFTRLKRSHSNR